MHFKHSLHENEVAVYPISIVKGSKCVVVSSFSASRNCLWRFCVNHVVIVPGCNRVNIVWVIVSVLSSTELVSPYNHRNTACYHLKSNIVSVYLTMTLLCVYRNIILISVSTVARAKRPCITVTCVSGTGIRRKVCKSKAVMSYNHIYRRSVTSKDVAASVQGISDT